MKKFLAILVALTFAVCTLCADEATLFDYTAKADVLGTGYDWVANAKAVGISGRYEPGRNLMNPIVSEKYGLAIRTDEAPNEDSNYAIEFITPVFNEANSGAGYIKNAAAVKSMDIVLTLNRGYDEVTVVWEQNGKLHERKFKASDATVTIQSMVEFTAHIDFSEYVKDPKNRSMAQIPVAGLRRTDIALKQIKVTTHRAPGDWMYSPTSIVGIKKITMVYDKAVTDEAYQLGVEADSEFNINASQVLENSTKRKIEIDLRQTEYNKSLMATEGTQEEAK